MADDKFGVIVVGAGLAGCAAAYALAKAGVDVLVIERGNYAGSKNVTGGMIYAHSLEKRFPDLAACAPFERRITSEKFFLRAANEVTGLEEKDYGLSSSDKYSILRAKFDRWFAEKAEEMGAMFVCGIRVDELIVRDGCVCGIVAGDEEMDADVIILAEGVNAVLAQKIGLRKDLSVDAACVGAKEVIELGEDLINERFGGEGAEWTFLGDRGKGEVCDGFLYTNRSSLSVGVMMTVADAEKVVRKMPEMVEEFLSLPQVAEKIEGGVLLEYAAHLLHKGSALNLEGIYADGVLVVGDTAGFVCNTGDMVRGMDMAVESGYLAAQAVIAARAAGDFSAAQFSSYRKAIEESYISSDMKKCAAILSTKQ
jgi:electron transfer flavoprotein-quinone oxidoreductase